MNKNKSFCISINKKQLNDHHDPEISNRSVKINKGVTKHKSILISSRALKYHGIKKYQKKPESKSCENKK